MRRKAITPEAVIKDNRYIPAICIHSIFMAVGILMTFATVIYTRKIDENSIIGTVFCFVVFGIPFGYFMGLKRVRAYADKIKKIQNGEFQIKKDLLVKKEMLLNGADTSNNSYQLEFKDWSRETDKVFKANYRKYSSVEENKEYYLVFIDGYVDPCGIYPVDEFELP